MGQTSRVVFVILELGNITNRQRELDHWRRLPGIKSFIDDMNLAIAQHGYLEHNDVEELVEPDVGGEQMNVRRLARCQQWPSTLDLATASAISALANNLVNAFATLNTFLHFSEFSTSSNAQRSCSSTVGKQQIRS
jgi:hypothetical protein